MERSQRDREQLEEQLSGAEQKTSDLEGKSRDLQQQVHFPHLWPSLRMCVLRPPTWAWSSPLVLRPARRGLASSIGVAKYVGNVLIILMPDMGYVLGADFLSWCVASKQLRSGLLRLGVLRKETLLVVKQAYRPHQTAAFRYARGSLPLHLK